CWRSSWPRSKDRRSIRYSPHARSTHASARKEPDMSDADIAQRFAQLSREQRAQLFQQLQQKRAGTSAALPPIRRQGRESNLFPVSFAQQRLWVLDQLDPNSPLYNIPEMFWVRGR